MKNIIKNKIAFSFVLAILILSIYQSCERDDICAESTPTTPRLKIEFYDATSQEDLKSVPRLTIYGDSPDIPIPVNEDFSSAILVEPFETARIFNTNTNAAALPLRINDALDGERTITRFILEKDTNLRLDEDDTTESNIDIIEISYVTQFEYVSRACGYKSIFTDLDITLIDDGDNWISNNIAIDIEDIENENTVHVRIFH